MTRERPTAGPLPFLCVSLGVEPGAGRILSGWLIRRNCCPDLSTSFDGGAKRFTFGAYESKFEERVE